MGVSDVARTLGPRRPEFKRRKKPAQKRSLRCPDRLCYGAVTDRRPSGMPNEPRNSAEPLPPRCELIEVHVPALHQLFNSIDPSPVKDRDLSDNVEKFIASWARDTPRTMPLALVVYVDEPSGMDETPAVLRDAVPTFFSRRALDARRRLRQLFRVGRTSLVIGLFALGLSIVVGGVVERALADSELGALFRESLLIGGWVAMWRPLEIFLYDWWPIRAEARLFDRLAAMPVRIERALGNSTG
jgi:hypothetical protein